MTLCAFLTNLLSFLVFVIPGKELFLCIFAKEEGIKVSDFLSFDEFVKNHFYASDTCVHPTLHRNQIDWLCDENGMVLMDYIFLIRRI